MSTMIMPECAKSSCRHHDVLLVLVSCPGFARCDESSKEVYAGAGLSKHSAGTFCVHCVHQSPAEDNQ